jgi:hypothetical protein
MLARHFHFKVNASIVEGTCSGTLTKRPRTKSPMDFSSQKFCNETSMGQNGPWNKAVLGQNILGKFATKRPHFHCSLTRT